MKTLRLKLKSHKGVTLVELIVSMVLLAIFCLCCSVLIRPCAEAFNTMQKTSRAQMIGDTIIDDLRSELMTARGTIRFAPAAVDAAGANAPFAVPSNYSVSTGGAIEFRTTGDYYEVLDAGYVPPTKDKDGMVLPGTEAGATSIGQLHMRYFTNKGSEYDSKVGYGYTTAYTDKFYMNNSIVLKFSVQGYSRKNIGGTLYTLVNSVRVDLTVKDANNKTVHGQSAILDLPNAPVLVQRKDEFAPK